MVSRTLVRFFVWAFTAFSTPSPEQVFDTNPDVPVEQETVGDYTVQEEIEVDADSSEFGMEISAQLIYQARVRILLI